MALPTLDAVFASAADQPRRMMLSQWLVNELGSGSVADYITLPERYLWAKIAVAAGAPRSEADYISLPKQYAWSDIYNAVSGDIAESTVVVSGLSDTQYNGRYVYDGEENSKPRYKNGTRSIFWSGASWILSDDENNTASDSDVAYPWLATNWYDEGIDPTGLFLTPETPNHTDWSEKQALGHIAAAYRGDTGNPANLATYIDWPWRYQVASIITELSAPSGPTFLSDDLLAFWKLDDLNDSSGNGYNLTNNNSVIFVGGKIGNCAEFDATNSLQVVNPYQQTSSVKSVSFWVKRTTSQTSQQSLICGLIEGWYINTQNDKLGFWIGAGSDIESNAELPINDWAHCVVVYNDPNLKFYIDGILDTDINAGTNSSIAPYTNIVLGAAQQGQLHFTGQIDAVGIWDRALTNQDVLVLYNNGNGIEL